MDLEESIPVNHLVRVVNAAVNRLDDATFDAAYPEGGRDSCISSCFYRLPKLSLYLILLSLFVESVEFMQEFELSCGNVQQYVWKEIDSNNILMGGLSLANSQFSISRSQ